MSEWEVQVKTDLIRYNDRGTEYIFLEAEEATDEEISDGEGEFEISVIRKDNEFGHESWGWSGNDKLILPFEITNQEEYKWALKVANTVADALNKEGL